MTGPFDRDGKYVEEWADDPSKWRKNGGTPSPHERNSDDLPVIAKNDQPPQNAVPLAVTYSKPVPVVSKPTPVISKTVAKSQAVSRTKERDEDSEPVVVKAKLKAKPEVVKAKSKPKSTRYVVKSGDSLSAIASRTGSSVSAIKNANGISGTMIRPGQSLSIPRK